jgi:hypothetical protein
LTPLPDTLTLSKTIPTTSHHLTWQQVVNPPWDAISALQGTVNAATFLGCPPGTVLFAGAEAKKLLRSGLKASAPELAWELTYTFREKGIKQGGQVYGWNYAYRGNPPGWVALTNGAQSLYDLADFAPLFQTAAS